MDKTIIDSVNNGIPIYEIALDLQNMQVCSGYEPSSMNDWIAYINKVIKERRNKHV